MKKYADCLYLSLEDIFHYIKNRPPLLMIKEAYIKPGENVHSNVKTSGDEWFFECHFPGNPMIPGVLQLEMIFNASALAIKTLDGYQNKLTNIAKINDVIFKRQIVPKEEIEVFARVIKFRRGIAQMEGSLLVGNKLCCKAEFTLVVLDDVIHVESSH